MFEYERESIARLSLGRCLAYAVAPLPIIVASEWLAVAPWGTALLLTSELLLVFVIPLALLALFVGPIFLIFDEYRSTVVRVLLMAAVSLTAVVGGLIWGQQIRMAAFSDLALHSVPLVKAIGAYQAANGKLPVRLEDLAPRFLPEVPSTGMGAYPAYNYYVGAEASVYQGNPWVLVIPCTSGGINFDKFMYFPLQNYPPTGFGGGLEPVRDWAYVHE